MAASQAPHDTTRSHHFQVLQDKVVDSYYKLTCQAAQIKAYVFDVVRSAVPKMDLDDVFISKEDIARDVKEQLTVSMDAFGLSIIQACLPVLCLTVMKRIGLPSGRIIKFCLDHCAQCAHVRMMCNLYIHRPFQAQCAS